MCVRLSLGDLRERREKGREKKRNISYVRKRRQQRRKGEGEEIEDKEKINKEKEEREKIMKTR